ncbi:MAG: fibronectin type III domain-containing protein [Methylobacter sp.]
MSTKKTILATSAFFFGAMLLLLLFFSAATYALPAPTNLTASAVSTTQINLKWNRVLGASSYRVYRANKQIATTRGTTLSNAGLTPNTAYSYNVAAVDNRWRQSAKSNTATATTLTDTAPPPPPPPSTDVVGYLGCSMTQGVARGAISLGYNVWNPVPVIGGGGIKQWSDFSSAYWKEFDKAQTAQPTTVFWWMLCALENSKDSETYDNALAVVDEIKRRVPGAIVYVSAQPAYNPSSHECVIAGTGGQARMASIAAQLTLNGEALAGPVIGPLEYPSQVSDDGCHQTTDGEMTNGLQLGSFFLTKPQPPIVSAGIASGVYVVDTEPNVSAALASQYVDGLLVRARWESTEPTEGAYNFKSICDKVTQAHKLNKGASLVFYPLPPKWLLAKVPTSEQWSLPLGKATTTIRPWNTVLLDAMKKTAEAMANSICEGVPIKSHPALKQVDTTIAGALSVRDKPSGATQAQMLDGILKSVQIWHEAFAVPNDPKAYYLSIFPYKDKSVDAGKIAQEILNKYPIQHFMTENWGVAGVGDTSVLKLAPYKIFQACGYFSNSNIKCSDTGRTDNTPQNAYDKILKPLGGVMSLQLYADDIVNPAYSKELEYLHSVVNPK